MFVTAARREMTHFVGLWKVLNVFSKEIKQGNTAIFLLHNTSES